MSGGVYGGGMINYIPELRVDINAFIYKASWYKHHNKDSIIFP